MHEAVLSTQFLLLTAPAEIEARAVPVIGKVI
jgi:hypothetical protein